MSEMPPSAIITDQRPKSTSNRTRLISALVDAKQRKDQGPLVRPITTSLHADDFHTVLSNRQHLDTASTWSILILSQIEQQFPKLLLSSPIRTALRALSRQINQLRDSLPASSSRGSILSALQELLSLPPRLRNRLLLLRVVVLIEIVDVLLRGLDGLLLLLLGFLFALGEGEVAAFAPFADYGWLFLVGLWGIVGVAASDRAAWSDVLELC